MKTTAEPEIISPESFPATPRLAASESVKSVAVSRPAWLRLQGREGLLFLLAIVLKRKTARALLFISQT